MAQNKHIQCLVGADEYSANLGAHADLVDTSDVLTFVFHEMKKEEITNCEYALYIHFKPAYQSRSMKKSGPPGVEFRLDDSTMTIDLSEYLLIKEDEVTAVVGYRPSNAMMTDDGKFVVDRVRVKFNCGEMQNEFSFHSAIAAKK